MSSDSELRIAFFGTPYVARDTLVILKKQGLIPSVIVTNPDAPRGRKQILTQSEVAIWANEHSVPVLKPTTLDSVFATKLAHYNCDVAVVVAYGKIFPESLIATFPYGALNVHYSLLPHYRGASPVESALLHNEQITGVTVQQMEARLDAGAVLAQATTEITINDTTATLRARLITQGAHLLIDVLMQMKAGTLTPQMQDESQATYAPKLTKADGEISLHASPTLNWNTYRAFIEWPGVYFIATYNGKETRVKITDAELTTDGDFKINRVIPEGKNEMPFETFQQNVS